MNNLPIDIIQDEIFMRLPDERTCKNFVQVFILSKQTKERENLFEQWIKHPESDVLIKIIKGRNIFDFEHIMTNYPQIIFAQKGRVLDIAFAKTYFQSNVSFIYELDEYMLMRIIKEMYAQNNDFTQVKIITQLFACISHIHHQAYEWRMNNKNKLELLALTNVIKGMLLMKKKDFHHEDSSYEADLPFVDALSASTQCLDFWKRIIHIPDKVIRNALICPEKRVGIKIPLHHIHALCEEVITTIHDDIEAKEMIEWILMDYKFRVLSLSSRDRHEAAKTVCSIQNIYFLLYYAALKQDRIGFAQNVYTNYFPDDLSLLML